MKKSVDITAARITAVAIILAAMIGLFKCTSGNNKTTVSQKDSSALVTGNIQGENITINYNVPETVTQDTIRLLEQKIVDVNSVTQLNREEIRSIALTLKDLDQRTSGIEKLPDGRTKFGNLISGQPVIVLEEHNAANKEYNKQNFREAFEHSTKAIKVFEESKNMSGISTGNLSAENIAKLYYLGAISAQRINSKELAYKWAKEAVNQNTTSNHQELLITALANLGQYKEALDVLEKELSKQSDNKTFQNLKQKILSKQGNPLQ